VILARTVNIPDAFAHANVLAALAGPGAPAGITSCVADGSSIVVAFDAARTAPELVDALIDVAREFVPVCAPELHDVARIAAIAARGLQEPGLDGARIIETYLP
jgi:hypothetical protein